MSNKRGTDRLGLANPVEQNNPPVQKSQIRSQAIGSFLDSLTREIATTLAAEACCIYVLDQQKSDLHPAAWWDALGAVANSEKKAIGKGIIGLAVIKAGQDFSPEKNSTQGVIRIDDFQHGGRFHSIEPKFPYNTVLAASIVTPGDQQMLGALLVAGKSDSNPFSAEDEQVLSAYAQRIDLLLALENLRSDQEKKQRDQELAIIHRFIQALAASPAPVDLESACHTILSIPHLRELFEFDLVELCLWDEQSQTLTSIERLPEDHAQIQSFGRTYQINKGFSGWIAAHQKSLLVSDVQAQIKPVPMAGLSNFPYRSYMGVPLKVGSEFLGTLEMVVTPPHFYDAEDLALLEIISGQASIVLDHARRISLTDQQLQQRVEELGGLQRVSNELNSTLDLNKILSLVLEEGMRVTQASFGNVSLYDSQTGDLTAHQEQSKDTDQPGLPQTVPVQNSIMGRALRSGQTILVPNVRLDKDFIDYDRQTRSQVVVPIFYGGEPAGVINLESPNLNCFTADQSRYLEALANHAAVAIGNAQAFQTQKIERERASRRAGQLARLAEISNSFRTNRPLHEMLEDIAYAIVESVGFNVVLISLVQDNPPIISHEVGAGIPVAQFNAFKALQAEHKQSPAELQQIMQKEFRLGQAYFIPAERMAIWRDMLDLPYVKKHEPDELEDPATTVENAWQIGDVLFVPLQDIEKNIIGLLTVENPDTEQRPDLATVQTLEIFANHAAAAIENARLFELEQQRRRLADTLRDVAETISSQLELDQLLNVILQGLKKVVNYDSANVQLLEEDKLVIIGGHGWEDSQQVIGMSFPMEGDNPNRRVIETQEPVIVDDVQVEYSTSFSEPPHKQIRSWLGVPLTYGTNVLGLMAMDSHEVGFFSREHADTVLAFANQVAVALQNVHLFDEARQQVRQLAALTEVAQSINRALDLDEVLNLVLDAVFDLIGEQKGSIWLIDNNTNTIKIANTKNIPDFMVEALNESAIPIDTEPFAKVITSGQISVIRADVVKKDVIANYGLPFPNDVTYVPFKTEEGVIGLLAIEGVIRHKNLLDLVTMLANLAAVAIGNAQLVQRLNLFTEQLELRVEQRTRQLAETLEDLTNERDRVETLYQITRELSTSLDLDRVLTEALNLINRAIGISHGSILLLDHGSGELIYRAALGRDKPLPRGGSKTKYRLGYGLAGTVMELQEPRLVPDLSQDPDWVPGQDRETPDQRSAMVVPLTTGEGMMGALLLFHPDVNYFTEDHIKLVSAAGAQIANAINNAELYRLITDQAERLGTMLRTQATEAAKNEAILKSIADGVLVLDAHRHVILLNPKGAEILCVDPKTTENNPVDRILDQSQSAVEREFTRLFYNDLQEALARIEAGQKSAQFRIDLENKAVVVTLTPVALGAEETLGLVAVLRDISKEAEIERLKNEFISTVSHELRTPLTSIKGYADLLVSGNPQVGELNSLQDRFIKVIQSNANRLTELVNDILEISRIETGRLKIEPEALDIIQLIKEVAVSFEGQLVQKSMHLSLTLPDNLPDVYADKARLTQILVNLIGNAWQYTPEGGKIEVSAALTEDNFVQVDVADNGIGIPEDDIDHIFERFFRSERHEVQLVDGTGLGLSITKSFVELLGGRIWLESKVNIGTTFSFTIPLAMAQAQETMPAQELAEDTLDDVE